MIKSRMNPEQIAHANAVAREWQNKPKCPTCNSTNVKPISALNRGASIAVLGVFSKKLIKVMSVKIVGIYGKSINIYYVVFLVSSTELFIIDFMF